MNNIRYQQIVVITGCMLAMLTAQISFAQESLTTGANEIYYVNNGKSNSLTLDKPFNSNAEVAIQSTTDYQAYGAHSDTLNTNVAMNFSYNGEYQDPSSDLVYLRARDYDAGTQRFIAQDNANVWNKYNFADSNPIMNIDPSGHFSITNVWKHSSSGLLMTLIMSGVIFTGGYLGIAELAALGAESVATSEAAGVATEGLEAGATATAESTDVAEGSSAALTQSANDSVAGEDANGIVDTQEADIDAQEHSVVGTQEGGSAEATNPNEAKFFSCVSRKTELRFGLFSEALSAVGVIGTYGSHFSPFLKKYEGVWGFLDYFGGGAAFGLIKGLKFADYVENASQTTNYLLRAANGVMRLYRMPFGRFAQTNFIRSASAGMAYMTVKTPFLMASYAGADAVYDATNHGEDLPDWV
ncbi:RHS repeat-associated core domain-containing protein [Cysteiniphilum sp. QT6929]|uniref:RHS repeat-associated core domain-containing protein n=1 Tax=Cysteiniphilum sp. QT6929 TaxID=2975055 RepID=UPI0024B35ADF|nr:RHS repeat-associated core domain-containing protein [Cysteiniphilum sp. QT6929]WHN66016.1 RHS repeat-associated core domain-containing protein [Cysteiniphilum sp. QT6929]